MEKNQINIDSIDPGKLIKGYNTHDFFVEANDQATQMDSWVQYKFPKSKKKRIRKKWATNPNNFRIEKRQFILRLGNKIIVPTNMYEVLKKELQKNK